MSANKSRAVTGYFEVSHSILAGVICGQEKTGRKIPAAISAPKIPGLKISAAFAGSENIAEKIVAEFSRPKMAEIFFPDRLSGAEKGERILPRVFSEPETAGNLMWRDFQTGNPQHDFPWHHFRTDKDC